MKRKKNEKKSGIYWRYVLKISFGSCFGYVVVVIEFFLNEIANHFQRAVGYKGHRQQGFTDFISRKRFQIEKFSQNT